MSAASWKTNSTGYVRCMASDVDRKGHGAVGRQFLRGLERSQRRFARCFVRRRWCVARRRGGSPQQSDEQKQQEGEGGMLQHALHPTVALDTTVVRPAADKALSQILRYSVSAHF